jgi:transcriptional regulator with XRE-family HTH domain
MPQKLGKVIAQLRRQRHLSQYEVARQSEGTINREWLAALETGRSNSVRDPEKIRILATILGVPASWIYEQAGMIDAQVTDDREALIQRIIDVTLPLTDDQKIAIIEFIERMYPRPAEKVPEKKQDESVVQR